MRCGRRFVGSGSTRRIRHAATALAGLSLAGVLASPVFAAPAHAPAAYTFTVLIDSVDGYSSTGFGCPAMNEAGQVAFRAIPLDGEDSILRSDGTSLTTVADLDSTGAELIRDAVSINNRGEVAFQILAGSTEAVYRSDGTNQQIVAAASFSRTDGGSSIAAAGPRFRTIYADVSIADTGRVAFFARGGPGPGLYSAKRRANTRTEYAASDTAFSVDKFHTATSFGRDRIAFFDSKDNDASGIYTIDADHRFTTIAEDTGPLEFMDSPSINAVNEVAFRASRDGGTGTIIAVGSGGPVTEIASTDVFQDLSFSEPSINDSSQVAFAAARAGDGQAKRGVYVGPDPVTDRVIGPGDRLAGSTVRNVRACGESFNNAGQVAFQAFLTDGRNLMVRAEPPAR